MKGLSCSNPQHVRSRELRVAPVLSVGKSDVDTAGSIAGRDNTRRAGHGGWRPINIRKEKGCYSKKSDHTHAPPGPTRSIRSGAHLRIDVRTLPGSVGATVERRGSPTPPRPQVRVRRRAVHLTEVGHRKRPDGGRDEHDAKQIHPRKNTTLRSRREAANARQPGRPVLAQNWRRSYNRAAMMPAK